MHPRRFARVRPTGRNSDVAKLILTRKFLSLIVKLLTIPLVRMPRDMGQTKLPNRFELLYSGTKSAVGWFGAQGGVGSHFNRLVCASVSRSQAWR